MRAMGLSYGALSDHHNTLNHDIWRAQEKEDFLPIVSKEISTTNGHVMALGVEKDVIYHAPGKSGRKRRCVPSSGVLPNKSAGKAVCLS